MQGQFKDLGDIEVAGQDVGFLSKRPGLHAAARPSVVGIRQ